MSDVLTRILHGAHTYHILQTRGTRSTAGAMSGAKSVQCVAGAACVAVAWWYYFLCLVMLTLLSCAAADGAVLFGFPVERCSTTYCATVEDGAQDTQHTLTILWAAMPFSSVAMMSSGMCTLFRSHTRCDTRRHPFTMRRSRWAYQGIQAH